jgi:hypothetical protein
MEQKNKLCRTCENKIDPEKVDTIFPDFCLRCVKLIRSVTGVDKK